MSTPPVCLQMKLDTCGRMLFELRFYLRYLINSPKAGTYRAHSKRGSAFTKSYKMSSTDSLDNTAEQKQWKQCQVLEEEEIGSGKWLKLNNITYTDPLGKERKYEAVRRTTKQTGASDAVSSIPILKRLLHYDCVVMVKQYRPAIGAYTIEFPAGLLDPGESVEECALRELKEETGFVGLVKHVSPATSLDAGVGNTTVQFTTVEIDGDLPENENAIISRKTDEGEFTEVIIVPLDELLHRLTEFSKAGFIVDSRVFTYAISMEQTKKMMSVSS